MAKKAVINDAQLSGAAREYVHRRSSKAGGITEAYHGLRCKTIPFLLGWGKVSWLSVAGLFTKTLLLAIAASTPIFVRKVLSGTPAGKTSASEVLLATFAQLDSIDAVLALLAIASTFIPRVVESLGKQKAGGHKHLPFSNLSAAIKQMPALEKQEPQTTDALNFTLQALRDEMAELVDDLGRIRITEATLLTFVNRNGHRMQVRSRTATNEPVGRPVDSFRLLAYYVALKGRPFIEHDFLHSENPFPSVRLTVPGGQRVGYRSVLYLPIMTSEWIEVSLPEGVQGAPEQQVVDHVIGVICVHCEKPYRFWRYGDHAKPHDGFGTIAYARALPYITLVSRLIEGTAPKVKLEVE